MPPATTTTRAQFPSSPKGARRARHFAVRQLADWGHAPTSDTSGTTALIVGELTANAVRHGHVRGRDFTLTLTLDPATSLLRIEVTDAATEKHPPTTAPPHCPEGESGRGLFLINALAHHWGTHPRHPLGKTVWAEISAPPLA
ncbi:ATP-binding protein [Streptomyces fumanus]|uniref:ATP-binding protein n=1 Tax=Streptomyces fumanus TaxID=67302 RepID=UPI003404D36E